MTLTTSILNVVGQLVEEVLGLSERETMSKEILKGKWLQVREDVPRWWARLTDDDADQIQGDTERFIRKLEERYGFARDEAETEINEFLSVPDRERWRAA